MTKNPLGKQIAEYRESLGWSQRELARKSGLSSAAINKIESGETNSAKVDNVLKIAEALNLSFQQTANILLGRDMNTPLNGNDDLGQRYVSLGQELLELQNKFYQFVDENASPKATNEDKEGFMRLLMGEKEHPQAIKLIKKYNGGEIPDELAEQYLSDQPPETESEEQRIEKLKRGLEQLSKEGQLKLFKEMIQREGLDIDISKLKD